MTQPKKGKKPASSASARKPAAAAPQPPPQKISEPAKRAFGEIEPLLQTGLTDWAVTDGDTESIYQILDKLARDDFIWVMTKLARTTDGTANLLAKYLTRGVLDHSGVMQAKWSEQFDRKIYYESGAYRSFDTLRAANEIEKEIARLADSSLWKQARLPSTQPLRGLLEQLRS